MKPRLQIGVVGSAGPDHSPDTEKLATSIGHSIASRGHVLVFGPELNPPSLSTLAAEAAFQNGGLTLAVALGRGKTRSYGMEFASTWVFPDAAGGGGREVVLANSCDGLVVLGGGVGTLLEIATAYTNKVPIALMEGSGGWADKLTEPYLDARKKVAIQKFSDIEAALGYLEAEAGKRVLRSLSNKES